MGIVVNDRVERLSRVAEEVASSKTQEAILYRGVPRSLPVVRLPVDLPLYRMNNGRTRIKQIEYARENHLAENFFTHGEENLEAQIAQHKILLGMSKDPKGNIFQELAKVARQTEQLLVTTAGITVNGNRRLAAMRELYAQDPRSYSEFEYINVIVLPAEATQEDIKTIEVELQLVPKTKLDYGWIERRFSLRSMIDDLRMPRSRVKDIFRFQREEDINTELGQLSLADQYLEEFIGKSQAYEEIEDSFQLFQELQSALVGKMGEEAEARRHTGFVLIKESRNLKDRAYNFRSAFGKDFSRVIQEFAKCNGISLSPPTHPAPLGTGPATRGNPGADSPGTSGAYPGNDTDDPLAGLAEPPGSYQPIIDILADQAKSGESASTIVSVMASIRSTQREADAKRAALKAVQDAFRRLSDVDLTKADPTTFAGIVGQLDGILSLAKELRGKLEPQPRTN